MRFHFALSFILLLTAFWASWAQANSLPASFSRDAQPVVVFGREKGNALVKAKVVEAKYYDDWIGDWRGEEVLGAVVTLAVANIESLAGDFNFPETATIKVVAHAVEDLIIGEEVYLVLFARQTMGEDGSESLAIHHALYWGYTNLGVCVPESDFLGDSLMGRFTAAGDAYHCID